jgi:hypothetical protein
MAKFIKIIIIMHIVTPGGNKGLLWPYFTFWSLFALNKGILWPYFPELPSNSPLHRPFFKDKGKNVRYFKPNSIFGANKALFYLYYLRHAHAKKARKASAPGLANRNLMATRRSPLDRTDHHAFLEVFLNERSRERVHRRHELLRDMSVPIHFLRSHRRRRLRIIIEQNDQHRKQQHKPIGNQQLGQQIDLVLPQADHLPFRPCPHQSYFKHTGSVPK